MFNQLRIKTLSKEKQEIFWENYHRRKLNMGSAWALWFVGFHYLHTGKVLLWFVYLISCFVYVGFIWWIIQGFMLKDQIEKKNEEIKEMIYNELR